MIRAAQVGEGMVITNIIIVKKLKDFPSALELHPDNDLQVGDVYDASKLTRLYAKPKSIRIITTSSMLRRFSITEEVAIIEGSNTTAKVIRERMIAAPYADLDFKELQESVAYVVNYLNIEGKMYGETTEEERVLAILSDGTKLEEYQGAL